MAPKADDKEREKKKKSSSDKPKDGSKDPTAKKEKSSSKDASSKERPHKSGKDGADGVKSASKDGKSSSKDSKSKSKGQLLDIAAVPSGFPAACFAMLLRLQLAPVFHNIRWYRTWADAPNPADVCACAHWAMCSICSCFVFRCGFPSLNRYVECHCKSSRAVQTEAWCPAPVVNGKFLVLVECEHARSELAAAPSRIWSRTADPSKVSKKTAAEPAEDEVTAGTARQRAAEMKLAKQREAERKAASSYVADMDLPSSEESEEEVDNKHRGAEADDVPLTQRIRVRRDLAM